MTPYPTIAPPTVSFASSARSAVAEPAETAAGAAFVAASGLPAAGRSRDKGKGVATGRRTSPYARPTPDAAAALSRARALAVHPHAGPRTVASARAVLAGAVPAGAPPIAGAARHPHAEAPCRDMMAALSLSRSATS